MGGIGNVVDAVGDAIGGVANAVGSVVGSVAEGIVNAGGAVAEGIGGIGSLFMDGLETIGGTGQDLLGGIGGAIADAADFLNPVEFFSNIGALASDIMDGPFGDIVKAMTDPIFNFAEGVIGFGKLLFGGDFIGEVKELISQTESVVTDSPGPAQREQQQLIQNTTDAFGGIFESLTNLNPASADFPSQLADVQQKVSQLGAADTIIGQMVENINEMAKRINPFQ